MTSTRFMVYRSGYSQNLPHMIQKKRYFNEETPHKCVLSTKGPATAGNHCYPLELMEQGEKIVLWAQWDMELWVPTRGNCSQGGMQLWNGRCSSEMGKEEKEISWTLSSIPPTPTASHKLNPTGSQARRDPNCCLFKNKPSWAQNRQRSLEIWSPVGGNRETWDNCHRTQLLFWFPHWSQDTVLNSGHHLLTWSLTNEHKLPNASHCEWKNWDY